MAQIRDNLQRIAVQVRDRRSVAQQGVGLWIPEPAANELAQPGAVAEFARWLSDRGLYPMTINGFPQGDFHQPVVKHRVYQPTWWDDARREHTLRLIDILHGLLPERAIGSISTLPIAWSEPTPSVEQWARAAANLSVVSKRLHSLEQQSGRRIVLAIEPEPGCLIDTTGDMIALFERHFPDPIDRRYLTVCHDVCHGAVMYEDQASVIERYAEAGIGIGKVQVSSAIEVPWSELNDSHRRAAALEQLRQFAEDRYLHQTVRKLHDGSYRLLEDLPELLAQCENEDQLPADQSWRIHFHVPIFLPSFGNLRATQDAVLQALAAIRSTAGVDFTGHWEVETYAWGVLPPELATDDLATAISQELNWFDQQLSSQE